MSLLEYRMSQKTKTVVNINDFFRYATIKEVLFKDEKTIIFSEQKVEKIQNRYSLSSFIIKQKSKTPEPFTNGSKDYSFKLDPSGTQLAFLSIRGGEKAKPQVFIIKLDGGEAFPFTSVPNGVTSFNWSLDGSKIIFHHRVNLQEQQEEDKDKKGENKLEDDSIPFNDALLQKKIKDLTKEEEEKNKINPRKINRVVYRKGTAYLDDRYSQIYILDIKSKKIERITSGEHDYNSAVLSADGKKVYAVKHKVTSGLNDSLVYSIVEIDLSTKKEKELKEVYSWGVNIVLSDDGKWLVYNFSTSQENIAFQNNELMLLNLETMQEKWISSTIDNHADTPHIKGNKVYFIVDNWDYHEIYAYDFKEDKIELIYSDEVYIYDYAINDKANKIALNLSTIFDPSVLAVYDIEKKKKEIWRESNKEWLKDRELAKTEEIKYKSFDDTEIQGWLVTPPSFNKKSLYPLVLEVHGGPASTWSPYERSMWHEFQCIAAQGYCIFYCNPRGSSGRGYNFRNIKGDWGNGPANDILVGFNIVVKRPYIDQNNLFVTGGSYGGYMSAWLISHDTRFRAAVPQRGVYNLVSFWSTTDITQFTKEEMGYYPWENFNKLWEESPIAHVQNIKTPTRLIHSDNDFRVPVSQGEELFVSLKKLGVEAEFIRYPKEGHELSRSGEPRHIIDRLEKIVEWFDIHKYKD